MQEKFHTCVIDCCAGVVKWLDSRALYVVCSLHGAACPLYVWVLSIVNGPLHMRKKMLVGYEGCRNFDKSFVICEGMGIFATETGSMNGVRVRPCSSMDRMEVS